MLETYERIPLDRIVPSPFNPRRTFDPVALEELSQTIREHGVLEPAVVRPKGDGYELVMGERRFRASRLAEMASLPCIVRDYTDSQVLEVIVIENNQRADVNAAEEAEGFEAILKLPEYARLGKKAAVDVLAKKLGRSVSYVWQRLKLSNLTEEARQELLAGEITPGHAILLARLLPESQAEMLTALLWETQWSSANERVRTTRREAGCMYSVREFAGQIANRAGIRLEYAPFDLTYAPEVGRERACLGCPARSLTDEDADAATIDVCRDRDCFFAKCKAFTKDRAAEVESALGVKPHLISVKHEKARKGLLGPDDYSVVDEGAPGAVPAILADVFDHMTDDRRGVKGYGRLQWIRVGKSSGLDPAEEKRRAAAEKQRKAELKKKVDAEREYRAALLSAVLDAAESAAADRWIRRMAFGLRKGQGYIYDGGAEVAAQVAGLPKSAKEYVDPVDYASLSTDQLVRYTLALTVAGDLAPDEWTFTKEPSLLLALAEEYGVDAERVRNEAKGQVRLIEEEPKAAPKPAAQPALLEEVPGENLIEWVKRLAMTVDPGTKVTLDQDTFEELYHAFRVAFPGSIREFDAMYAQGFLSMWGRHMVYDVDGLSYQAVAA